ncbi:DMT family transporter [Rhodobacter ferrooxidans]|uniref:EamA domain-containing protein n=1 Tax=Rhodobacter ferrooxidans TaxID=371731 RepID=C8S2U4_9RHOB|nr:DMT family transporter [Rhodobacter sp. SW2]EEW24770.1 protein of unknown function DUF6 transmembrane [Rhodobacter sp. SW2]
MARKDRLDGFGAIGLLLITAFFAFNQVIIKITNVGLQPVFLAGLRSVLAVVFVLGWMALKDKPVRIAPGTARAGLAIGVVFAAEFLCLFMALDLTTVSRAAIIFYSMPVWLALMAHFGLPGERLSKLRLLGLGLAFAGTAWAILDRGPGQGHGSLAGDLFALGGALGWAGTAFIARRPSMTRVGPEMQLLWMVVVSGPILLLASPLFGPLFRDLHLLHLWLLLFQAAVVVAGGFIFWLWLLSVYPASTVASFSFLTPVFGLGLGWLLLDEPISLGVLGAASLVAVGIILINRRG